MSEKKNVKLENSTKSKSKRVESKSKSKSKKPVEIEGFFIEWEIYTNLQIFCNEYGNYKITSKILTKSEFTVNLQYDKYIKLEATKNDQQCIFYIATDDIKQLPDFIQKNSVAIKIIYPSVAEKYIVKLVNKLKEMNIIAYNYDIFKIVHPKRPGASIYKVLSPDEVIEICKTFNCIKSQFPKILRSDTLSVWYNVQLDDVIEETALTEIIARRIYYRHCNQV